MGFVALLLCAGLGQAGDAALFDYDPELPLELDRSQPEIIDGVHFAEISYSSPMGGRVPAFLVAPPSPGPHAGIVFVHWGQGNKSEFVAEALVYARAGAVSLAIDAPHMRPDFEGPRNGFLDPAGELQTYRQLVIDIRRGFDVLTAVGGVDPERLGYVGHSLGATFGGVVAGVDPRSRALVLMAGLPSLVDPETSYPAAMWKQIEDAFGADAVAVYRERLAPLSPERFVGQAAPGSVYFQFARYDRFVTGQASAAFTRAAGGESKVSTYPTGHELNDLDSLRDRAVWLESKLELDPVLPLLRARLAP